MLPASCDALLGREKDSHELDSRPDNLKDAAGGSDVVQRGIMAGDTGRALASSQRGIDRIE